MARQQGVQGENNFIQGLITETTALKFPPNACTETFNCVFDETGRVTRRLGIDLEEDFLIATVAIESLEVFTEYRWDTVAGSGERSFLVQQQGSTLRFYDVSDSSRVSPNDTLLSLDLDSFLATGSSRIPAQFECQYSNGLGNLIVVNPACDPFYVTYNPAANTVTGTAILIQHRDFTGVEDGLAQSTRPTSTVANLQTTNPEHYYNLLNQGWYGADALAQWDTARTDLPSNEDYIALFRASATDAFDNARVLANATGNRLASKGHFILTAWDPDRTAAMVADGFTGATILDGSVQISAGSGTAIGNLVNGGGLAAAFDGVLSQTALAGASNAAATSGYIGKTYSSPFQIAQGIIHGSNNSGFDNGGNGSCTITLYGKQGAAPSSGTDGTILGTTTFTDTGDESAGRTITSTDLSTSWDHAWFFVDIASASASVCVAEARLFAVFNDPTNSYTIERPRTTEFFAGRAWFAGIDTAVLGSNIYFSQICEDATQFGKCYQKNDPTAEDFTDLLSDDGGVIKIPEIGKVIKLFAYQSSLMVFATNGVWLIGGSAQTGGFLATDFTVKRLSNEGTNSPLSFLSNKGVPAWWGADGIFTVQFDSNYGSFNVISITDEKIKSFIFEIPTYNRRFVKAAFDSNQSVAYWLYSDEDDILGGGEYVYNKVLVANGLSGAFYPWELGDTSVAQIRGISYIQDPANNDTPQIKYTTTMSVDASNEFLVYSDVHQTTYKDWSLFAVEVSDPAVEIDYTSYFITGYRLDGQTQRFFQPNYVFTFMDQEDCASLFMQGIFDFTTSGDSGKWSTRQQVYDECLTHRSVSITRRKVRGKGRALQLRFSSESGQPFSVIGWSIRESSNADI